MTRKDQHLKTKTLISGKLVNLRDTLTHNFENFEKFARILCTPSLHAHAANQYIFQRFNLRNFHLVLY